MAIKSNRIAACNTALSFCNLMFNPIAVFCSPSGHIPTLFFCSAVLSICTHVTDGYNSDCFHKNYRIAKAAGYTDGYLAFCAFFVQIVLSASGHAAVLDLPHYSDAWQIPSLQEHFSIPTLLTVIALVAVSDWFFYSTHRLLHERFPKVHLLHHCCIYSSLSTNLFFEPLDILLEFMLPIMFLQFTAVRILGSSWTYILATSVLQTYYTLSHDEWLGWQHTRHHRTTSTGYFIYYPYFSNDPKREQIRKLIPKISQIRRS